MLPLKFKKYFWDTDFKKIDIKKNAFCIIERLLEYGDKEAIIWMMRNFKKSQIKQTISKKRGFSSRSANYWASIFGIPKNKILCLKRSYQKMQKSHWLPCG